MTTSLKRPTLLAAFGLLAALHLPQALAQGENEHAGHHPQGAATGQPQSQSGAMPAPGNVGQMPQGGMMDHGRMQPGQMMDHGQTMQQMHEQHMNHGQMGHGQMNPGDAPSATAPDSQEAQHDHDH
ncbi:hypothetical protein NGA35_08545 [Pseudomonas stutzeri]|nr:hypothetical protein [Stutzerimonas stutzeri]